MNTPPSFWSSAYSANMPPVHLTMTCLLGVSIVLAFAAGATIGFRAADPPATIIAATFGPDDRATYCTAKAVLVAVSGSNRSDMEVAYYFLMSSMVPIGTGALVYMIKSILQKSEYQLNCMLELWSMVRGASAATI